MKSHYEYDFFTGESLSEALFRQQLNQSRPMDFPPKRDQSPEDKSQLHSQLESTIEQFLKAECFKSEELRMLARCIFRLEAFRKLGLNLYELCLLQFQLVLQSNGVVREDRLQILREQVYDSIKSLSILLGREKDKYLSIIPLVYKAILLKLFELRKINLSRENTQQLGHILYFQIKGQLVSAEFLNELVLRYLNRYYFQFLKTPLDSGSEQNSSTSETSFFADLPKPSLDKRNQAQPSRIAYYRNTRQQSNKENIGCNKKKAVNNTCINYESYLPDSRTGKVPDQRRQKYMYGRKQQEQRRWVLDD